MWHSACIRGGEIKQDSTERKLSSLTRPQTYWAGLARPPLRQTLPHYQVHCLTRELAVAPRANPAQPLSPQLVCMPSRRPSSAHPPPPVTSNRRSIIAITCCGWVGGRSGCMQPSSRVVWLVLVVGLETTLAPRLRLLHCTMPKRQGFFEFCRCALGCSASGRPAAAPAASPPSCAPTGHAKAAANARIVE
jgi:hypothetical protein